MDNDSKERTTTTTVGLDLGDKYTHLCLLDTNKRRGRRRRSAAHHPRCFRSPLRLREGAAEDRHRGRHPFAVGEPSA